MQRMICMPTDQKKFSVLLIIFSECMYVCMCVCVCVCTFMMMENSDARGIELIVAESKCWSESVAFC